MNLKYFEKGTCWVHKGNNKVYAIDKTISFQLLGMWFTFVFYNIRSNPNNLFIRPYSNFIKRFHLRD